MGIVARAGNLTRVLKRRLERQHSSRETRFQRLTFHVLQDQVIRVVLVTDVEECTDMRMTQAGDRPGFALAQCRVIADVRGQDFDRDGPIESRAL
jgi:hypothetical protein